MPPIEIVEVEESEQVQRITQFIREHRLPVPDDRAEADTRLQKIAARVHNYWRVPFAYLVSDEGQDRLFELCEAANEWMRVLNGAWTDEEVDQINRDSSRYGSRPKTAIRNAHHAAVVARVEAILEGAAHGAAA